MDLLTFLIGLAALATLGVLAMGIGTMVHGGAMDERRSGTYMAFRVGLQVLTFLMLLGALALKM
ncbi:HIG1 domain-containing protein [Thiohalorhabdus sp.]|uniref:HIG1 domain-containing protein n=1 Tax=Thiohalorhabdus sp. TaxID=3094134 RepID=UPI002FC34882